MKYNKQKIVIGVIGAVVVILSALLGYLWAKLEKSKTIDGIVVPIRITANYEIRFITTYDDYLQVLDENYIDEDGKGILKEKDFKKFDYIVDYIPYDEKLEVKSINVDVVDGGANLKYVLNHEVGSTEEMLIYFIPVEKDLISEFSLADRTFEYKK